MTPIHAYASSQSIVDGPNRKFRFGRAAACNFVPTSTGAAQATSKALPQLKGNLDSVAVRGPVPSGSIADIVFFSEKPTSIDEVNRILEEEAATDRYHGILGVTREPLVSSVILGDPRASHRRPHHDPGDRRRPGEGDELVGQRVGLR